MPVTFAHDWTAPDLVCHAGDGSADLTRLQERAYQAILTLRRIPFDAPLPWTDRSLFGWFTHAVTGVDFDGKAEVSHCCGAYGHIVIRSAHDMVFLTENRWTTDTGGLRGLVALLLHEARHAEGYRHDCNATDPNGDAVDDLTIDEMGAWGVQYWFDVWLTEHASSPYMAPTDGPPDAYVRSAADGAAFILRYRICEPPPG